MENYIVINGKKAELTEEQLRQLGIEVKKESPFKRVQQGEHFCYINYGGDVFTDFDGKTMSDDKAYAAANYCTDKNLMQQRAWFETLSRLLWRYSMEHDGDKIQLNHCWALIYNRGIFEARELWGYIFGECVFYSKETAQNAIEEIVKPFMAEHPDFKW